MMTNRFLAPSNIRLFWKGLLLIGFPVLVQIVLTVAMISLLLHEQNVAAMDDHAKEVINQAHIITSRTVSVIQSNALPDSYAQGQPFAERSRQLMVIKKQINILQDLISSEPEQKENAEELKRVSGRLLTLLTRLAAIDAFTLPFHTQNEITAAVFDGLDQYFPVQENILKLEIARRQQAPAASASLRIGVHISLLAAVVASVLVAAAMAVYYIRSIKAPLQRLSDNATRMSRREALPPAIEGSDEFARLDKLFHTADQSLGEANEREKALLTNAADMICSLDRAGNFQSVNPFGLRLLGHKDNDLIGVSIFDFAVSQDRARLEAELKTATSETRTHTFEISLFRHPAEVVDTFWSCFWSQSDQRLFCVVHDITEQKAIDRFKQDLFAMISHDLRTPLTSVSGRMEMLQMWQEAELEERTRNKVANIRQNVKELLSLIDDLLDFQRLRAQTIPLDKVKTDIKELLLAAITKIDPARKERGSSFLTELEEEIYCICDLKTTQQVFETLLSAALKNSPDDSQMKVKLTKTNGFAQVSIEDKGGAKLAALGEQLFSVFERLSVEESDFKSRDALALSIAKLIVDRHDGTISVESNQAGGATFSIQLPLADINAENANKS